ncbi:retrotransposon gag protein [Cucumis melo var. makuwa]|uniref:Retrotransposon gag protein n=1 Tax=Cucumis melo var. makuwa TaxID=1194695 RepID=A0A5A7UBC8_CUCMM|nr:retrotransposon gag protein [Cucumis melo var. makuwa]
MESPKAWIVIKENSLYDNSYSASSKSKKKAHPDVMSVMMVDITVEAAMAKMERKINFLMKVVEERDHEITTLREQMHTREIVESSQTPIVKATDKGKNVVQENQPQQQSVSIASLSVQQLQDMITNSIRAYLKGNAFEWYTDLEPEVIDSWEQLEEEFLNRFYSTRRTIYMMELTNTKQWKGEPVIDYINRCSALSLDCKDKLTKLSAVEMCTEDMLEQLIEKQLIQLPECKRPEKVGKVDDLNYYKYHRVISHPVEKCFVLKELILKLAR